ncbi:MAG: hypothetical protein ACRD3W_05145, partial [Terriglobales bacterium]
ELGSTNGAFENTFSGSNESPAMQRLILPAEPNKEQAKLVLAQLFEKLAHGAGWQQEPPLRPGQINCCNVVVPFAGGKLETFIVQAAGSDGKPPPGAQAGTSAFVALQDGKEAQAGASPSYHALMPRKIWVIATNVGQETLAALSHASLLCFAGISALLGLSFAIKLPRQYNIVRTTLLLGAICLTGLYVLLQGL